MIGMRMGDLHTLAIALLFGITFLGRATRPATVGVRDTDNLNMLLCMQGFITKLG
jgi:hypothetical protein